jgi:hypothetical protein
VSHQYLASNVNLMVRKTYSGLQKHSYVLHDLFDRGVIRVYVKNIRCSQGPNKEDQGEVRAGLRPVCFPKGQI